MPYQSGRRGNHSDDPISHILKVSNQGGFRYRGSLDALDLVALVSSLNDPDWPDTIDRESGTFIYFGDNKRPGRALHETLRFGNELLRRFFEHAHSGSTDRSKIPPIFVFAKTGEWRDVRFIGLAVPGGADIENYDDLVAVWRTSKGLRFQNYRARFTILDVPHISGAWLDSLAAGVGSPDLAPAPWREWIERGRYRPLKAVRSIEHRVKNEQLPTTTEDRAMVSAIRAFFAGRPHDFERCAASLARMMLPDIVTMDLTRPSRDGGRDAIGKLNIGRGITQIWLEIHRYLLTLLTKTSCNSPSEPAINGSFYALEAVFGPTPETPAYTPKSRSGRSQTASRRRASSARSSSTRTTWCWPATRD